MSSRFERFAKNTGYLPDGGICVPTGKRIWLSRSDAKKALRKFKGQGVALQGAHAYECPHRTSRDPEQPAHWHLGHPPKKLRHGQISRDDVRGPGEAHGEEHREHT